MQLRAGARICGKQHTRRHRIVLPRVRAYSRMAGPLRHGKRQRHEMRPAGLLLAYGLRNLQQQQPHSPGAQHPRKVDDGLVGTGNSGDERGIFIAGDHGRQGLPRQDRGGRGLFPAGMPRRGKERVGQEGISRLLRTGLRLGASDLSRPERVQQLDGQRREHRPRERALQDIIFQSCLQEQLPAAVYSGALFLPGREKCDLHPQRQPV